MKHFISLLTFLLWSLYSVNVSARDNVVDKVIKQCESKGYTFTTWKASIEAYRDFLKENPDIFSVEIEGGGKSLYEAEHKNRLVAALIIYYYLPQCKDKEWIGENLFIPYNYNENEKLFEFDINENFAPNALEEVLPYIEKCFSVYKKENDKYIVRTLFILTNPDSYGNRKASTLQEMNKILNP